MTDSLAKQREVTLRIIVCGGREFADRDKMFKALTNIGESQVTIVHGAARGADTLAADVAEQLGWTVEAHPADWNRHGKAAGIIRNQKMLDTGVDGVIAMPGGRGTADMVRRAQDAGIPVEVW